MAGGGSAGKVYFVLYLAVVLELLIIIVERDEAEEHLEAKRKESELIVRSILAQLQSGSGTEGINTKPQDEVTIPPEGMDIKELIGVDIKSERRYVIEVGVTDVLSTVKKGEAEDPKEYIDRIKKLIKLANVQELNYQIFYCNNEEPGKAPPFPDPDYLKSQKIDLLNLKPGETVADANSGESWLFVGSSKLEMDEDKTYAKENPKDFGADGFSPIYKPAVQIGDIYYPRNTPADSIFFYSKEDSGGNVVDEKGKATSLRKRAFVLNFEPPRKAGWYKLRFASRTNRILGIRLDENSKNLEASDEDKVNIGTVQLKVGDLRKVIKTLEGDLDPYRIPSMKLFEEENGDELFKKGIAESIKLASEKAGEEFAQEESNIKLYGYIARLLTPGKYSTFDQNKGAIEFDIRVVLPEPPQADPIIAVNDEIHTFADVEPSFRFSVSPWREGQNKVYGAVYTEESGGSGEPVAQIEMNPVSDAKPANGQARDYYGKVTKRLLPGNGIARKYILKLTHELMSKKDDSLSTIVVYPTTREDDVNDLKVKFGALAVYGNQMFFDFTPPSGRNIAPDQFGFYFSTDADPQGPSFRPGLKAERSMGLDFSAKAKKATLKIVWKDPISKKEVEIFPETTVDIKQTQPTISTNFAQVDASGEDNIRVRISNIKVNAPAIGSDDISKTADIQFDIINTEVKVKQNFKLVGKPQFSIKDGQVTINLILSGDPDDEGWAKGTVELKLSATAVNPINGATSPASTKTYIAPIKVKFEDAGGNAGPGNFRP